MTPLRQLRVDDMQLKGLSASTQQGYLNAVRRLAGVRASRGKGQSGTAGAGGNPIITRASVPLQAESDVLPWTAALPPKRAGPSASFPILQAWPVIRPWPFFVP
jgi:hypothetical protein